VTQHERFEARQAIERLMQDLTAVASALSAATRQATEALERARKDLVALGDDIEQQI
jgi:hypothetical protein